jgi:hypothetical protein
VSPAVRGYATETGYRCEVEVNPKDWCRVATHMLPCTACVAARPPRASGVRLSSVPYGKVKVNLKVTSSAR